MDVIQISGSKQTGRTRKAMEIALNWLTNTPDKNLLFIVASKTKLVEANSIISELEQLGWIDTEESDILSRLHLQVAIYYDVPACFRDKSDKARTEIQFRPQAIVIDDYNFTEDHEYSITQVIKRGLENETDALVEILIYTKLKVPPVPVKYSDLQVIEVIDVTLETFDHHVVLLENT